MKREQVTNHSPIACAAPPLTDELLAEYEKLAQSAEPEVKDAMDQLLVPIRMWWDLPESTNTDVTRWKFKTASGGVMLANEQPLDDGIAKSLWESIPWTRDLMSMKDELFEKLPNGPLRNAAFHLWWYVRELDCDREPITSEKLVRS